MPISHLVKISRLKISSLGFVLAIGLALPDRDDEDPVTNGEIQGLFGVQRSRVLCFECFSCPSFAICDISMKFEMCRLRLSDNTTSLSPSVQILHCFQSLLAHFYRGIEYISKDYWLSTSFPSEQHCEDRTKNALP